MIDGLLNIKYDQEHQLINLYFQSGEQLNNFVTNHLSDAPTGIFGWSKTQKNLGKGPAHLRFFVYNIRKEIPVPFPTDESRDEKDVQGSAKPA